MALPYRKIFKQAYEISRNNRFLWIFGLFLLLGSLFNFNFFFRNEDLNLKPGVIDLSWFQTHAFFGNLGLLFILAVVLELILLYFKAKAGCIIAVKAIVDKQQTSFVKSFHIARLFHWRLFGVFFLTELALLGAIIVIGGPILYLFSVKLFIRALVLLSIGLIILFPTFVLAVLVNFLAPMFIVLHDFKIGEAIRHSVEIIGQFWSSLLVFGFLLFWLTIFALFISIVAGALAASPFVLLAYLAYHKVGIAAGIGLTIISVALGSIVFLAMQAAAATFAQTAWVLAFLELVKPQKLEEEESLPVPEII